MPSQTGSLAEPRSVRISPLTGRTGGRASAEASPSVPTSSRRPAPSSARLKLAARQRSPRRQTPPSRSAAVTSAPEWTGNLLPLQRGEQRGEQPACGSTLASPGHLGAAPNGRGEPGLEVPAGSPGEPLRVELRGAGGARSGAAAPPPRRDRARRGALRVGEAELACPTPASSSPRTPGQRRSDSRLKASSASSPQDASPTGASMPGGDPGRAGGRAVALEHADARAPSLRRARRRQGRSRRRRRRSRRIVLSRFCCSRRSNLPAPALPGSGSDGRRRFSRPLSPWWAPVAPCYPLADLRSLLQ